jgi:hypothetical protein
MDSLSTGAKTPALDVVDRMEAAGERKERVSLGAVMRAVGERSFGPLLLVPGLIVVSPLSGIPGLPTIMAAVVLLIASQLLMGMDHIWLPQFLLRRSVSAEHFRQAIGLLKLVARASDSVASRRLTFLTRGAAVHVIALSCALIALTMPLLEVLPFANSVSAAAISAFGLALTARDGLLAAVAFVITGAALYLMVAGLFYS